MVVKDISQHYHQWGARRFWFTDAQFITGKEAYPQCTEILERIVSEKLDIEWSGYIRTSLITPELAKLMVRSGVGDLEVAITSGSQEVLNNLHMGFKLERLYDGCRYLAEAGFKGKVILNYSLNSPKETEETPAPKRRVLQEGRLDSGRGAGIPPDVLPGHPAQYGSGTSAARRRVPLGRLQPSHADADQHPQAALQPGAAQQDHCQGLPRRLGTERRQPRSPRMDRIPLSNRCRRARSQIRPLCRREPDSTASNRTPDGKRC